METKLFIPNKDDYQYELLSIDKVEEDCERVYQNLETKKETRYGKDHKLINSIFNEYPLNVDENIIAMKIALIDVTNSTHIAQSTNDFSIKDISTIIKGINNFDLRVSSGDTTLVDEIANKTKEKGRNLFSFATKYCCYHNVEKYKKDDYSIYDNIVKDNLPNYIHGLSKNTLNKSCRDKINYKAFNDLIGFLLDENKRHGIIITRRDLDHYIWWEGKNK